MTDHADSKAELLPERTHFMDRKALDWLCPQMSIVYRALVDSGSFILDPEDLPDACRFLVCLRGDIRICRAGANDPEYITVATGFCCLHYRLGPCPCMQRDNRERSEVLELVSSVSTFVQLLGDTWMGRELAQAVDAGRSWCLRQSMGAAVQPMLTTLREITAHSGADAAPLVLAKAIELIWLLARCAEPEKCGRVSGDTCRAVKKAGAILENKLPEPPPLEMLAAQVGMSLSKLKMVFPRIYGIPPYAYLRQVRMERAMQLLKSDGLSVTEAAFEVGYSNLSYFSKSFAAYHGVKPSAVRFSGAEMKSMK